MKKKILNTDDNDTMNATADVRNYGAGSEAGIHLQEREEEEIEDMVEDASEVRPEDKPLPGEIANPEEQEEADEMA